MSEDLFGVTWYDKSLVEASVFDASIALPSTPPVVTPPSAIENLLGGDNGDIDSSPTYDFTAQGWFHSSLSSAGVYDHSLGQGGASLPPPVVIPGLPVTPIFRCKKSLLELAETFRSENRPIVQLLEPEEILAQLISATEYYDGYAELEDHREGVKVCPRVTANTRLNESEQALIWPLFLLYIERESVLYAEASRGLGLDSFIRPSSEIAQDIQMMQQEWPHMTFYCDIVNL